MDPLVLSLWQAMSDAFAVGYRAAPAREVWLTPTAALILSGEPLAEWNCALIFGGTQAAEHLRTFSRLARARGMPLQVMVAEELATDVAMTTQELGLTHTGTMPLMVYRPQSAPLTSAPYQVTPVESEQDLRTVHTVAAGAFSQPIEVWERMFGPALLDAPGWKAFLARRDGIPMSAVFTLGGGKTIGVFAMGTPPEHQRKGAGYALLSHAITWHYDRGARIFYLFATAEGYPLYERIGFRTVSNISLWVAEHAAKVVGVTAATGSLTPHQVTHAAIGGPSDR